MVSIRSVFRRLPSVTYSRGKYHVHGSTKEILDMCIVCVNELLRRGIPLLNLWTAFAQCKKTTERQEDAKNEE